MKDLDSKLIFEAYDTLTLINTLANTFVDFGETSFVNVSKNQMKKYFQQYIEDSGIANDPAKLDLLERQDDKGEKARQKLFTTVLKELRDIHGIREPEPEPEPELAHPLDLDPRDDETLPPPEHQEPDPEPEPEDTESWFDALKKGKIRIPVPQLPKIKFK